MEDNVKNYDFPDFGPDDDTEDMTGVLIYDPHSESKDEIPNVEDLPEFPLKLDDHKGR
tara:strand:+ start:593 stop:766 length:174 start_codon:yes stop_codon:yes gene_type:complete